MIEAITRLLLSELLMRANDTEKQDTRSVRFTILCLAGALWLAFMSFSTQAADYNLKMDTPSESKIVLESDRPWLAQDKGEFVEGWKDDYGHHISHAKWTKDSSTLTINVYALSGLQRWRATAGSITERAFRTTYGDAMTSFAKVGCPVGSCVRFDLSPVKCFSALYFTAPPGSKTQSDKGKDLVNVIYCSVDLTLPDDMENLLSSIKIRKNN